jgi:hypothetical protein
MHMSSSNMAGPAASRLSSFNMTPRLAGTSRQVMMYERTSVRYYTEHSN